MKRKLLVTFVMFLMLTSCINIVFADTVIKDQYNESGSAQTMTRLKDTWLAQSFKPSLTDLTQVRLYLNKDSGANNGNVKVAIRSSLTGSNLGVDYYDMDWVTTYGAWHVFYYSPSISLTPGNTYYIVLYLTENQPQDKYLYWWASTNNAYTKGKCYYSVNGGSTWYPHPDSSYDTLFQTWGTNYGPNKPSTPSGPGSGYTGVSYTYSSSTTDPEGQDIYYWFNWGDGTNSGWLGPYDSGSSCSASHSWSSPGTYSVKVKAKDVHGDESVWSDVKTVTISDPNSPPNTPSTPSGPSSGYTGVSYTYSTSATDPDGDDVYYWFSWGDGTNSGWVGPYNSGETGSASHSWSSPGTYSVKAKAKDTNGAESGWSNVKTVTISNPPQNDPPNTPSTPSGPSSGYTGVSYTYSTSTTDPDGDDVYYWFSWGDGSNSGWVGPYSSGETGSASKIWNSPGTYSVKAKAKDTHNDESGWSGVKTVVITDHPTNEPPIDPATPEGPMTLEVDEDGTYSTFTTDPDGDKIQYQFDWDADGSHEYSSWTNLLPSGQKAYVINSWDEDGIYVVKARARDEHGETSGWSSGIMVQVGDVNNPFNNYAVIIASGKAESMKIPKLPKAEAIVLAYWLNAADVVFTLRDLNWKNNNIEGVIPWGDYPFIPPDAEHQTKKDNARYWIETWLGENSNEASNSLIYMIGPFDNGVFGLNRDETISSYEINDWLEDVKYNTLTIVLEGSYSGAFIEDLSAENRIIITSATAGGSAYFHTNMFDLSTFLRGKFSYSFLNALKSGNSYGRAWEIADNAIYKNVVSVENLNSAEKNNMVRDLGTVSDVLSGGSGETSTVSVVEDVSICHDSTEIGIITTDDQNEVFNLDEENNEVMLSLVDEKQVPLIDDNGDGIGHGTEDADYLPIGGDGNLALVTYPGWNQGGAGIGFESVDLEAAIRCFIEIFLSSDNQSPYIMQSSKIVSSNQN
jgi:hypothetical protein